MIARLVVTSALLAVLAAAADKTWPVTEGDAHLHDFHFQTGETMPDLKIHYRTLGAPRRDASGTVRNAVLILHGTTGAGTTFLRDIFAGELFGPGQPLDITKYYVILPDGIGHGHSSKPSDGLRAKFPRYGYTDMVEAQYRLLREQLGVNRLRLVMGTSMGCMHSYVWMERHPDFLDAAMPLACQPMQISGRNLWWRLTVIHAIRDDPAFQGGNYTENPASAKTAAAILAFMGGNPLTWQKADPTREKGLEHFAKITAGPLPDVNDTAYAVDASWDYDPEPGLREDPHANSAHQLQRRHHQSARTGDYPEATEAGPLGAIHSLSVHAGDSRPWLAHQGGALEGQAGGVHEGDGTEVATNQLSLSGTQRDSNISIRLGLLSTPEATDKTTSTSSSCVNVGSQSFINRKVIAAFAPTRLLPSINA